MALNGKINIPPSNSTKNQNPHSPLTHQHHVSIPICTQSTIELIQSHFSITKRSRRRSLNLSIVGLVLTSLGSAPRSDAVVGEEVGDDELRRYTDLEQGFTLLVPSSYVKVDKAGANALFEEVNKGANNVGVVVTPVRITSLKEFGSPEFVADKLIQAEKRKESTQDIELIAAGERPGETKSPVYEFEYKIDSTRGGLKRIFSAAFVSSKKLYLLNIAHADKPESPLDRHTQSILEQVMHSFGRASST
ncbi:PsbP domain-containing protein [Drosera capensis]